MKRKMNRLSFSEIYQLPFKIDDDCPVYVWSSSGILTFNVCIKDLESVRKLIDILNGDSDKKVMNQVSYKGGRIIIDGIPVFLIRGWGQLTGCGALNLPYTQAKEIQDDFGKWIVKRLKKDM